MVNFPRNGESFSPYISITLCYSYSGRVGTAHATRHEVSRSEIHIRTRFENTRTWTLAPTPHWPTTAMADQIRRAGVPRAGRRNTCQWRRFVDSFRGSLL